MSIQPAATVDIRRTEVRTCGSFGGRTAAGGPCPRVAGWGVSGNRSGRCRDHSGPASARLQAKKRAFLKLYRTDLVSLRVAAERACGVDQSTLWRWRRADPEFESEVAKAIATVDDMRAQIVEDMTFRRIVRGDASASLTIFWLKNRAPKRWKDKAQRELAGISGQSLVTLEVIRSIIDDG